MTKYLTKITIFLLGIFIGLLLRELTFVNENLMPVIYDNQILVGLVVVSIMAIVLMVNTRD